MAEVNTGGGKKVSTKVDMTPMVDLAFLLITFFMLTTTFAKPQTMLVNLPDKTPTDEKMKLKISKTWTILLAKDNRIFYYNDPEKPEVEETNFADNGLRRMLVTKIKQIGEGHFFIIKASDESNFKNVVDILDEMAITKAESYALVDITPEDIELIQKTEANNGPAGSAPTAAAAPAPAAQ
jgi:biopolymer transport protein ExbD